MKNIFVALACSTPLLVSSQAVINLTPKVISATLYQNGALVTEESFSNLEQGKTTIVFHGLPSRIDKQSIQLSSNGDITILSVTSHDDYLSIGRNNTKVKKMQDSLQLLNDDLETINNSISILNDAKTLLDNNRTVGGNNTGTTVLAVKSMFEYYVKQVNAIDDSLMRLRKRQSHYSAKIAKVTSEIAEWRAKADTIANDVEASISSDKMQNVSFHLSYLTYDANWAPDYDLRAANTKHPCSFSYKANISQHTGQDWNNIDLTLSSSNPVVNQTAPTLSPWYLTFAAPPQYHQNNRKMYKEAAPMISGSVTESEQMDLAVPLGSPAMQTYTTRAVENATSETQLSVEFHIDMPYSLPSDSKPHTVEIKKYDLNAYYHSISIPKLQKDVFLLAGITQWEDLNILPGEVNIYYGGAYIGKSYISPETASDTLNFSLGMDKKVVVKRTRTKDFSATHWIGDFKTQTFGWEITLHNSHSDSLSMDVFDQIPMSTDKDIVITPVDLNGASEDPTGKLTWHITLAPSETRKLTFTYSVQYPKNRNIPNLLQ